MGPFGTTSDMLSLKLSSGSSQTTGIKSTSPHHGSIAASCFVLGSDYAERDLNAASRQHRY
jgi:hypothetical protein